MGLLDQFSNLSPDENQGLLAAAAQMLQASGPSLMPHSFGQVLGQGLQGYQAGRKQAMDMSREQMQADMLKQQVEQATRKNQLINNFLAANMGGGQAQPLQQAQAPQTLPIGSTDDTGRVISTPGFIPPTDQAPRPMAGGASASGFGGVPSAAIAADLAFNNGGKMGEWINDRSKPTDFARMMAEAGIDQNSTLGRQIMQQHLAKENNIPLIAGRAGAPMYNPDGTIAAMAPMIPKNAVPTIENGRVTGVSPLAGAAQVEQINAFADRSGTNQAEPISGFDAQGNPVFGNKLDAARGGPAQAPAPILPPGVDLRHMTPAQKTAFFQQAEKQFNLRHAENPGAGTIRPGLAPGVEKSIAGNVETMNNDFADLYTVNKNAPVTLAILDNIKKLAPAAITGTGADKLKFMNGLLTLGGLKPAKDLAEASDLMDKNANMLAINMRLGASGGGSDALQALAQAANPNSHMQPGAAIKAADEVIGQIKMKQELYTALMPYKLKNDVQGFYDAQKQFTSQADPRTYQPDNAAKTDSPAFVPGQKFNMLPPAARVDGKRMQSDDGTIYKSIGGKWVKQ